MRVACMAMSWLFLSTSPVAVAANLGESVPFTVDRDGREARAPMVPIVFRIRDTRGGCVKWQLTTLVAERTEAVGPRWVVVGEARSAAPIAVLGMSGAPTVVVAECPGRPGYSLHGPYLWGQLDARQKLLEIRPRRTVRVEVGTGGRPAVRLVLPDQHEAGRWPQCTLVAHGVAECIGVPMNRPALVIVGDQGGLRWGMAKPDGGTIQSIASQTARWGRVIEFMTTIPRQDDDLQVNGFFGRHPSSGPRPERVRWVADSSVSVHTIGRRLRWVEGQRETAHRFLEVKGRGVATVRVDALRLAEGAPEHSFPIYLRPPLRIEGTTVDTQGIGIPGTLVSAFELIDADPLGAGQRDDTVERRWIAETVADGDGRFSLSGPPVGRYEFLAVHPRFGRTSVEQQVDGRPLTIRLEPTARVKGRVVQGGLPREGVPIRTVPDQSDLAQASDPVSLLGPGVVSESDGRFELALPPRGGGEVVVGGGAYPRVRHRYPDAASLPPVTDLGDIELPLATALTVRLNEPGCEVTAVGPLGSLGLSRVRSRFDRSQLVHRFRLPEAGLWWLEARCLGRSRRLTPPIGRATAAHEPAIVDVTVNPVDSHTP